MFRRGLGRSKVGVQLVYDELAELQILDRVTVHSFDEQMLQAFKDVDPSVPQMYSIPKENIDLKANIATLTYNPDLPNYRLVDSNLAKEAYDNRMDIIPWTVDEYDDMISLINAGVDGILSNYPDKFEKIRNSQGITG